MEQGKTKEQIEQEIKELEEQKRKLEPKPVENGVQEPKPEQQSTKNQEKKQLKDTNEVFVGIEREKIGDRWQFKKSTEKYIMAVVMTLNKFGTAIIKGRGRAISRCFDIAHNISLENMVIIEKRDSKVAIMQQGNPSRDVRVTEVEITLKKI